MQGNLYRVPGRCNQCGCGPSLHIAQKQILLVLRTPLTLDDKPMTQQANRYLQMIRQMIATSPDVNSPRWPGLKIIKVVTKDGNDEVLGPVDAVSIEYGLIFPHAIRSRLAGDGSAMPLPWDYRWAGLLTAKPWPDLRIKDLSGHWRGVYDVLVPYSLVMALWEQPSSAPVHMRNMLEQWTDWHTGQLRQFSWPEGNLPAAMGTDLSMAVWRGVLAGAWSLFSGSGDGLDLAEKVVQMIASRQLDNGSLLHLSRGDNPEPMWYHELQILHAMGTLGAILAEGRKSSAAQVADDAARRNARYQQEETQPDHATTQPWGINVAMREMETWPLADQLLQAAMFNQAGRVDAISLMLMADSLYWFGRH